ncbi:hypothetical protein QBC39DRAFT_434823 [Podospora conica]|nr:hypothetical protein QBC39DRAFT_434823 [Schizothecium conicum]
MATIPTVTGPIRPPARVSFVFALESLLAYQGQDTAVPMPDAFETLRLLQENHIPFVVLFNGIKMMEQDVADLLNHHFKLPRLISWRAIGTAPAAIKPMVINFFGDTILVIGGNGEAARKVAWHYGFEFVLTTSELAYFLPQYAKYRPKPKIPYEDRPTKKDQWVMTRPRKFTVKAVWAMWEPEDWDRDTKIVTDILLNGGKVNQPFEIPTLFGSDRLDYIRSKAPAFYVCSGGVPESTAVPGPSGDGAPVKPNSWLGQFRAEWESHPRTYPPLRVIEFTSHPKMTAQVMRHTEDLVSRTNALAVAAQKGIDPSDAESAPNPNTVYLVGSQSLKPYFSNFDARWRDILVEGQQVIGPEAKPWLVTSDLRAGVEHALAEEYWDCYEAGYEPEWPRPLEERRPRSEAEGKEKRGPEWLKGVFKGIVGKKDGA